MSRLTDILPTRSLTARLAGLAAGALLLAACASGDDSRVSIDSASDGAGASQDAGISAAALDPSQPAPGTPQHFTVTVRDRVFFGLDQHRLDDEGRQVLERQAAWLRTYPTTTIIVEGHADERGTRDYNLALGQRRATAMKDFLVSMGVAPARIRTISYGKERPVVPGSNESAYRLNRRGVTKVDDPRRS